DEVEVAAPPLRVNSNYLDGYGSVPALNSSAAVRLYQTCSTCGSNAILGKFRNNVLRGGENLARYGMYEFVLPGSGRTVHPEALQNNDFFFPSQSGTTDVLYHLWNGTGGTELTTMAQVNALSFASAN